MVFSSLLFLFRFLPLMLICYYGAPRRFRNGVLFAGSLIFYGWGEPVYICLLLFSTVVDYFLGKAVWYNKERNRMAAAKLAVASSAVINLSLLCFFKYADFAAGVINQALGSDIPALGLKLPVGISFYTFQTMSYTIDLYRGKAPVQKQIVAFGAYVSMFPQLIAGPIVRYQQIAGELTQRRENYGQFALGVRRFAVGLGKKVLIANQIGALWSEITGMPDGSRSVTLVWMGVFAFGMQIYFDFSGYSDMAVGLGHMLGFHLPENFHYPYESRSITEFWRRWHISLGDWFKEYVYIPLGGNRRGGVRQVINILAVWALTGLWHGAGWNFLLWGLYFGILLLIEKLILKDVLLKLPGWGRGIYAMGFVFLGWVLFAFDEIGLGLKYFRQMFFMGGLEAYNDRTIYLFYTNLILIAAAVIGSTGLPRRLAWALAAKMGRHWQDAAELLFCMGLLLASTAYLVDQSYNPFLYFRF